MTIDVLTLFPEMFEAINHSILMRAQKNNLIKINLVNIRDFSKDANKRCDDYSYGGGAGMIMTPQPLYDAIMSVKTKDSHVVYLSPKGKLLKQNMVEEIATKYNHLVLVCGHYEGIDERALELIVTDYYSIGDYVLTGGELPSMVMIDAIARNIDGVLNNKASTEFESFCDNLLEYPQYTRPPVYEGMEVPEVLLSGHHANIEKWRREKSIERTLERRPDLLDEANLSKKEIEYLNKLKNK